MTNGSARSGMGDMDWVDLFRIGQGRTVVNAAMNIKT
jgi:hypothetical protein